VASEKAPQIVIKKITVVAGGAHGGAWKVAFADFMTAMMAFFLVMWLLATSSEPSKKAISDYFSTPSIIEYQFNNLGAELTLEKLFLDLVNEPLKVFQAFVTPMDRNPNMMAMGMKKVVSAYMAEQLGGMATNVSVNADSVVFEIPDNVIFEKGTANPTAQFVAIMERVKGVTAGLEDSNVVVSSVVFSKAFSEEDSKRAEDIASARLDMVESKVKGAIANESVDVTGKFYAREDDRTSRERKGGSGGYIRLEVKQKKVLPDGKKPRPLSNGVFSEADGDKSVYDNFVNQVSKQKRRDPQSSGGRGTDRRRARQED
jgi:chemotaxis protein MotB